MGYACPVCEDPQSDGEHLANHLAFTAMLGDEAHERWLDDRVPDWGTMDPPALADHVTDHAEEREFPQVFEDTTPDAGGQSHSSSHDHGHHPDHDHGGDHGYSHDHGGDERRGTEDASGSALPGGVDASVPDADDVPEDVMAQARELTRRRRASGADDDEGDDDRSAEADESGDS